MASVFLGSTLLSMSSYYGSSCVTELCPTNFPVRITTKLCQISICETRHGLSTAASYASSWPRRIFQSIKKCQVSPDLEIGILPDCRSALNSAARAPVALRF